MLLICAFSVLQTWSTPPDADVGRDVAIDGANVVVVGTNSFWSGFQDIMVDSATIALHDKVTGALVAQQTLGNTNVNQALGRQTWFLDVIADGGFYYASGKSDNTIDLCPLDTFAPPPTTAATVAQVVKYDANLVPVDCTAIPLTKNGNIKNNEISGLDAGDGFLWIGGSEIGDTFLGGNTADRTFAHVAPVPSGDAPSATDIYVARLSADFTTIHVTALGSDQWDEVLALDYEPENDMLYIAGSTKGDLCAAYPANAAAGCVASNDNTPGTAATNRFDSYIMALKWNDVTLTFDLKSVLQQGVDGEDTFNALTVFKNGGFPYIDPPVPGLDLGYYVYAGGKYDDNPADASVVLDKSLLRVRVLPTAALPSGVIMSATTLKTYTIALPLSDTVQGIAVTPTDVFVSGGRNITSTVSHAGPCAGGLASAGVATVDRFAHPTSAGAFTLTTSYDAPIPIPAAMGHDATDAKTVAIDGNVLYVIGQTTAPATAFCGALPTKDRDDDLDMVLYTQVF